MHLGESKGSISKHIYGHFTEHLGRCIYEGIWVGKDSPIPNTDGIRNDVLNALKAMRIPVLRWPGGCFADEYHWKDGIGPASERPRMVNTHWGGVVEDNSFGTHEFFRLCELLECDAYVCGNVGSGTVQEMQEWVEYITGPEGSPMGQLRARNGHPEPWPLKFFGVGNESWGCGGNMRAEYYADLYRRYQTYVRHYRPGDRPLKIACGSHDGEYQWTEVLMREAARLMDGLSLHYYTIPGTWKEKGSATEFGEEAWFTTLKKALVMDELVRRHGEIMDRYDPSRQVGLVVDEWGTWYDVEPGTNPGFLYQQNTLRDAMVAAVTLNVFNNHADRVTMANLAQTVNVLQSLLLTRGGEMIKTPTYHVFQMYAIHQGNTQLRVSVGSPSYTMGDASIDQLSASASRDAAGAVHLSLCNLHHDREAVVRVELDGRADAFHVRESSGTYLSGAFVNSKNTFDDPEHVTVQPFRGMVSEGGGVVVTLPARSIVQLALR